ncbi:hypothetical protein ACFXJ5_38545 [Streptomyces sp. NPDC059373]
MFRHYAEVLRQERGGTDGVRPDFPGARARHAAVCNRKQHRHDSARLHAAVEEREAVGGHALGEVAERTPYPREAVVEGLQGPSIGEDHRGELLRPAAEAGVGDEGGQVGPEVGFGTQGITNSRRATLLCGVQRLQ